MKIYIISLFALLIFLTSCGENKVESEKNISDTNTFNAAIKNEQRNNGELSNSILEYTEDQGNKLIFNLGYNISADDVSIVEDTEKRTSRFVYVTNGFIRVTYQGVEQERTEIKIIPNGVKYEKVIVYDYQHKGYKNMPYIKDDGVIIFKPTIQNEIVEFALVEEYK